MKYPDNMCITVNNCIYKVLFETHVANQCKYCQLLKSYCLIRISFKFPFLWRSCKPPMTWRIYLTPRLNVRCVNISFILFMLEESVLQTTLIPLLSLPTTHQLTPPPILNYQSRIFYYFV